MCSILGCSILAKNDDDDDDEGDDADTAKDIPLIITIVIRYQCYDSNNRIKEKGTNDEEDNNDNGGVIVIIMTREKGKRL